MNDAELSERLELFFGQVSTSLCYVYARLAGPALRDDWQLGGTLTGPACSVAATLPATFRYEDQGPGDSLLARAVVPEPSLWTPELPHWYQAEIELREGSRVVARTARMFGIRPLGVSGTKLIYTGKRWVLRGVCHDEVAADANLESDLAAWRESDTSLVVSNPSDALCERASRQGVLIVAELNLDQGVQLARLARWPAVAIAILPAGTQLAADQRPRNLVLALRRDGEPAPGEGARLIVTKIPAASASPPSREVATIALRKTGPLQSVVAGRAACDRLQSDLAPLGDWAGYIV